MRSLWASLVTEDAHEVFVSPSAILFPGRRSSLCAPLSTASCHKSNIRVWTPRGAGAASDRSSNAARRANSEALREAFFASLRPDFVIVTSLFEGLGDDCITSVNQYATLKTAVVLYDLIPLIYKESYLEAAGNFASLV